MKDKRRLPNVLLCTLVLLILIIPFTFATSSYSQTGTTNSTFINDEGIFSSTLVSTITGSQSIGQIKGTPLFDDLDGDGDQEIVVLHGTKLSIFEDKTLTAVLDFTLLNATGTNAYPYVFDIDGDGKKEIIVGDHETSPVIEIIEYNGTSMVQQASFRDSTNNHLGGGDLVFACKGINDCAYIFVDHDIQADFNTNQQGVYAIHFDQDSFGNETLIFNVAGTQIYAYCMPNSKTMPVINVDGVGDEEYIFSFVQFGQTNVDNAVVKAITFDGTTPSTLWTYSDPQLDLSTFQVSDGCSSSDPIAPWSKITSPLVADLIGASNTFETVIGFQVDSSGEDFKMKMIDEEGVFIDDYPELTQATGKIVSNVFLTNIMSGTFKDFCVLGHDGENDELDMLCGTEAGTLVSNPLGIESDEFFLKDFSLTTLSNITNTRFFSNNIVHSSQQGFSTGTSDIITSYGIFDAPHDSIITNNSLNLIFQNPFQDSLVLMLDVEENGFTDMLVTTTTNIRLIDDSFSNTPAQITNIRTNPCLLNTVKVNSSVSVFVTVQDTDVEIFGLDQKVSSNSSFYFDDVTNKQSRDWKSNATSGVEFVFEFVANKTGFNNALRVYARDTEEPALTDLEIILFNVQNNGLEFGDAECDVFTEALVDTTLPDNETGIITTGTAKGTNVNNNSITNTLETMTAGTGIGIGIFWLIIIAVGIFSIFEIFVRKGLPLAGAGMGSIAWTMIMIIMGTFLGFISPIILIVMFIFGIFVVIMFARNMFTGGSGDSGMA